MFLHSHLHRRKNGNSIPQTSRKPSGASARKNVGRPLAVERLEERTLLSSSAPGTEALRGAYGQLPLAFEANQGQAAAPIHFVAPGSRYPLAFTPGQATPA